MPVAPTPWTSQRSKGTSNTGTFISDRIHPADSSSTSTGKAKASGQGNRPQSSKSQKPQSPAVQALQKLISNLSNPPDPSNKAKTKDDDSTEGCFCLAQLHKLSPYVSICHSCGLILCEINQPYRPCPYKACGQPLLSPQGRATLIESLNEKVARTLEEESELERKLIEEERRAAGAFPELKSQGPHGSHGPHGQSHSHAPHAPHGSRNLNTNDGGTHKVLSLTQKGAVLTTVRKNSPSSTPKPGKADLPPIEKIVRVPAPSEKPSPQGLQTDKDKEDVGDPRPWQNPRVTDMAYVPLPKQKSAAGGITGGSNGGGGPGVGGNANKRRKKKKGDQNEQLVP